MSEKKSVSIITPVYNEEEIIETSVKTNLNLLLEFNLDFEIIIVNDGSTDESLKIIHQNFSGIKEITVLNQDKNKGFGSTVMKGIAAATKNYILCVPVDSSLTNDVLSSFLQSTDKADIIVSYRLKRLGYNWRMKLNSIVFRFLVIILFNINLRDFNWIHMYPKRLFDDINVKSSGLFMLAEILVSAKRKGYTFYEIPVEQKQRLTGIATASKLSSVLKTIAEMLQFYFKK